MKTTKTAALSFFFIGAAFIFTIGGQDAHAAGFYLRDQSACAEGMADAGVSAGCDNGSISGIFFNPATLTLNDGIHLTGEAALIMARAHLKNASASTYNGYPITGTTGGNMLQTAVIPATYGSWQVTDDLYAGFSFNAPWGLVTSQDEPWIGRYHGITSALRSYNFTPMLAWKPTDWLSLGAGFQVQYLTARLTSAVDVGSAIASQAVPLPGITPGDQSNDSYADIKGDAWSYGYTLGMLLQPSSDWRIGVGYRSKLDVDLKGRAHFTLSPSGQLASNLSGALKDTGGSTHITLPETVSLGIRHDLNEKWTLAAELAWMRWSSFDKLIVKFDNPSQPDEVTVENWKNSVFASIGTTYHVSDKLRLRAGVAYDEGVIPSAKYRDVRIPDADRYWVSVGAGYDVTDAITVDGAYTHIFSPKTKIDQNASAEGNQLRGNLSGKVEGSADVINTSVSMAF